MGRAPLSASSSCHTDDLSGAERAETIDAGDADLDFGSLVVGVSYGDAFSEGFEVEPVKAPVAASLRSFESNTRHQGDQIWQRYTNFEFNQDAVRIAQTIGLSESDLTRWSGNNVGIVFQFYNLLPMLTAAQNIERPLLLKPIDRKARRARVDTVMRQVGIAAIGRAATARRYRAGTGV